MPLLNYWELTSLRRRIKRLHGVAPPGPRRLALVLVRDAGVCLLEGLRAGLTGPHDVVPFRSSDAAQMDCLPCQVRLLCQSTETIVMYREEIERNVAPLGQLDLVMARFKLGMKLEGVVPEVGTKGVASVWEARQSILLLRGLEGVVGSDVDIGGGERRV